MHVTYRIIILVVSLLYDLRLESATPVNNGGLCVANHVHVAFSVTDRVVHYCARMYCAGRRYEQRALLDVVEANS